MLVPFPALPNTLQQMPLSLQSISGMDINVPPGFLLVPKAENTTTPHASKTMSIVKTVYQIELMHGIAVLPHLSLCISIPRQI